MEKNLGDNNFYKETLLSFEHKIQDAIDKKLSNLKPARSYAFTHKGAYKALRAIDRVNQKYKIDIFLVAGGLLGLVREGKLLDHDYDLDMSYFTDDTSAEKLIEIFENEEHFEVQSRSSNLIVVLYKDITIDLFGHYSLNDSTFRFSTDIHSWDNKKFGLKKVEFMNIGVLIPDQPEQYLTEEYGDWKNKKIGYDFSYHNPNRSYNGLPGLIYLIVRLENAIKNGWDSYASMAVSALYRNYNIDYRHIFSVPVVDHPADSLKPQTIVYVTTLETFDHATFEKLKSQHSTDKNFIVVSTGRGDAYNRFQKIVQKLSFVTQVASSHVTTLESLKALYPDISVIQDTGVTNDL